MRELTLAVDAKAELGEGPSWDSLLQCLYWVDIIGQKLHIYDPADQRDRTIEFDQYVSSVLPGKPGEVIVTLQHGFYRVDLQSGKITPIAVVERDVDTNRFNDGKCDPAGRLWAGTMAIDEARFQGNLYRLDPDLRVTRMLTGVSISNGMAWSSDAKTMYYIDTPTREIVAFDYDISTGAIRDRRVVVRIPEDAGYPDGMTIDAEDMLWVAHWEGGRISRWDPHSGSLLEEVIIPASRVTSCVFAGPDLTDLYITTARVGLDEATLKLQPGAGGLFRLTTDVKGSPTFRFAG
ncbi:MAG: SMP-30/gluconolactonase/LRE family protein [Alicyclobacillus macrosporangiidus]|uniref:SMP-30/gluconolactonase/LRE family protein n=1 Tax=Alicyclobacillus macrosporangiidus TaxID=392015 RepID=UPI0026EB60E8|nr:SMP-30/gluconolactonase/LRE family protein [Alicyclobacillus macrosporangiidus]MCL6599767.1 SMP-30/gluconolactonase/LRE family protein [Alicyclobacillus macrosporangiidus]